MPFPAVQLTLSFFQDSDDIPGTKLPYPCTLWSIVRNKSPLVCIILSLFLPYIVCQRSELRLQFKTIEGVA